MFAINQYFDVAFPAGEPVWYSPNEVVLDTPSFLVRKFRGGEGPSTLILPPQAGHSSTIADYDDGKSVVQTTLHNRIGPVFCVEWRSATQSRKRESLDDLVTQVGQVISHIGSKVHLIGLCQGGWLAITYAALYPKEILTLMPVASPIDFHKGGGTIHKTITSLGMGPYRDEVRKGDGVMRGRSMLLGWKLMHPVERFCGDYVDIYTDVLLNNTKKLEATKRFRTWYEHTLDISGVWYLQACEQLFLKNLLIKGGLFVHDRFVDLSKVLCKIAMIAGEDDDITLVSQLFALKDHVTSKEIFEVVIPKCGHIGCFMGRKSQKHIKDAVLFLDDSEVI